jgi:hypothetical protein
VKHPLRRLSRFELRLHRWLYALDRRPDLAAFGLAAIVFLITVQMFFFGW